MRTRRLKIGDQILEEDEFSSLIYTVVKIEENRAIAASSLDGKVYLTTYRRTFKDPNQISTWFNVKNIELPTTRKLLQKRRKHGHSEEGTGDHQ